MTEDTLLTNVWRNPSTHIIDTHYRNNITNGHTDDIKNTMLPATPNGSGGIKMTKEQYC